MLTALFIASFLPGAQAAPKPSARQLAWQSLEYYAFCHFGPNTFTNKEWGEGREDPNVFAPTALDCRQWARVFRSAGMKGVIITAKHHDGFCLWPSKFSTHTVAQSKWKGGKGDVLRALSDACRSEGLKFGVYLSPWDRNHPTYGTPQYNRVFASMLEEVLTNYGPIFEVWFDGACGEGPNGKKQVYDWELFHQTVRKFQPKAVIFSDAGPDVRWVGNEQGYAGETLWNTIDKSKVTIGGADTAYLNVGDPMGRDWVPAECDVSIRPGWFYHSSEDSMVKSVDALMAIWRGSVGRGANLLLNVPPDRRGQIHEADSAALHAFRLRREESFDENLVRRWKALPNVAGKSETLVEVELRNGAMLMDIELGEDIQLGQAVRAFRVEEMQSGLVLAEGTTIGRKRIIAVGPRKCERMKIVVYSVPNREVKLETVRAYGK